MRPPGKCSGRIKQSEQGDKTMVSTTRLLIAALVLFALKGCFVAAGYAVKAYKERDFIKLEILADGQAEELFAAMDKYSSQRNPNRVVDENDFEKLKFKGSVTKPSGHVYTVTWEVEQLNNKQSQIDFMARIVEDGQPIDEAELEGIAFGGLNDFCRNQGVTCTIDYQ
jgi:hypothetical protein